MLKVSGKFSLSLTAIAIAVCQLSLSQVCLGADSGAKMVTALLIASAGQAGMQAQSGARAAAQSSAGSNAAAVPAKAFPADATSPTSNPTLPETASPTTSNPAISNPVTPAWQTSAPASTGGAPSAVTAVPANLPASAAGNMPAAPQLRGIIGAPRVSPGQDNSVESFFQCPPVQDLPVKSDKWAAPENREKRPFKTTAGRAIWHIMDNVGVPMFAGNHDEALDPNIRRGYVNPPLPEIDKPKTAKKRHEIVIETPSVQSTRPQTQSDSSQASAVAIQRKIPDSELEGIEVIPGKDDAQK